MDISGVDFEQCFKRKNVTITDGVSINFLHIEDLITAKKETGRFQDLADAEQLEKMAKQVEEQ